MQRYRDTANRYGFKWFIGIMGVFVGLHLIGGYTGEDIFHWIARALFAFIIFSWVYDYMRKRVGESTTTNWRDEWR